MWYIQNSGGVQTDIPAAIEQAVKDRFAALARSPAQEQRFPVGPESAKRLGYAAHDIDTLPTTATESFADVGNPFSLGELRTGQSVLDLGCGAGMDSRLAARQVQPRGTVIGVDIVEEMLAKAQRNAEARGLTDLDFRLGRADALPVPAASVGVMITNGVFNLCLDKPKVVAEIFHVLRPGGRLHMADIFLEEHVTPEQLAGMGTWSDGVAGAIWERSLHEMLRAAGFVNIGFHGWTGYQTSSCTQGALVSACKPAPSPVRGAWGGATSVIRTSGGHHGPSDRVEGSLCCRRRPVEPETAAWGCRRGGHCARRQ